MHLAIYSVAVLSRKVPGHNSERLLAACPDSTGGQSSFGVHGHQSRGRELTCLYRELLKPGRSSRRLPAAPQNRLRRPLRPTDPSEPALSGRGGLTPAPRTPGRGRHSPLLSPPAAPTSTSAPRRGAAPGDPPRPQRSSSRPARPSRIMAPLPASGCGQRGAGPRGGTAGRCAFKKEV